MSSRSLARLSAGNHNWPTEVSKRLANGAMRSRIHTATSIVMDIVCGCRRGTVAERGKVEERLRALCLAAMLRSAYMGENGYCFFSVSFIVICTDLTTRRIVMFEEGPLKFPQYLCSHIHLSICPSIYACVCVQMNINRYAGK